MKEVRPDIDDDPVSEGLAKSSNGRKLQRRNSLRDMLNAAPSLKKKKSKKKRRVVDDDFDIKNLNKIPFELRVWNLAAAAFQFMSAVPLFWLASRSEVTWYIYTLFPYELKDSDLESFDVPNPELISSCSLTWYSAIFLLLSGAYHLAVGCPGIQEVYEYYVARHQNPIRWVEYAVTASLMRIMNAQLAGVTNLHTIMCLFLMCCSTISCGACHESINAKARADGLKQNWFPFFAAWIPQAGSWMIIFWYFFASNGKVTAVTAFTLVSQLFLESLFALTFYMQWSKRWIFEDYIVGEKAFCVLSFVAKALLAWINLNAGAGTGTK